MNMPNNMATENGANNYSSACQENNQGKKINQRKSCTFLWISQSYSSPRVFDMSSVFTEQLCHLLPFWSMLLLIPGFANFMIQRTERHYECIKAIDAS